MCSRVASYRCLKRPACAIVVAPRAIVAHARLTYILLIVIDVWNITNYIYQVFLHIFDVFDRALFVHSCVRPSKGNTKLNYDILLYPNCKPQYFTLIVPPFREAIRKFCANTKVCKTWVNDHQALGHQSVNVSFCNNTDFHQTRHPVNMQDTIKMQATIKMQDSQSIRTAIKWGADRRKVKQDEARRHTTTISWQGKSRNMWCWSEIYD